MYHQPHPFFAVVGGNVGFGLNAGADSIQAFQERSVEPTDDVRTFSRAVEAAVVYVHRDASGAHEPRGLRQPGPLACGRMLDDDLVAPIGTRIRRGAVGDLDEVLASPGQGVEHQARPSLGSARFAIFLGEGKAE